MTWEFVPGDECRPGARRMEQRRWDTVRAGSDPSRPQEKATDLEVFFEEWMARDQEGRGIVPQGFQLCHRIEREVPPPWATEASPILTPR